MNAQQLQAAADDSGINRQALCWAAEVILPVLRRVRSEGVGWRVWQRWGMDALIYALDQLRERCGDEP